jgi:hypothetical protein
MLLAGAETQIPDGRCILRAALQLKAEQVSKLVITRFG